MDLVTIHSPQQYPAFIGFKQILLSNHIINRKAVLWTFLLSHSHHQHQVKGLLIIFFWSWILETALCFKSYWREEMTAWVLGCIYILTGIYCSDLFARNAQTLPFSSQLSSPWKSKLARIHHFFFFSKVPIKNIPIVRIIWIGKNNSIHTITALQNKRILENENWKSAN